MKRLLVQSGVLAFALSVLVFLMVQAATPGCGGTSPAPQAAPTAQPQAPQQVAPEPAAHPTATAAPTPAPAANAVDPRYFPASKAGPVFVPSQTQQQQKPRPAPNAPAQQRMQNIDPRM